MTGAGSGLGRAIALALARRGAVLSLVGRREGPLAATRDALRAEGGRGEMFVADVTRDAEVAAMLAAARAAHGRVDLLVNNAGAASAAPLRRTTPQAWREQIAVNLEAVYALSRAALDDLEAAPAGRIVNIVSTAGLKGYAYTTAYCAAKHGAIGFTRALALELARTRVTVNAVCPGFADTEMTARSVDAIVERTGRSAAEARAELARFNPQGRLVAADEVADAVVWLASPAAASVTGQAIVVAGGEVM